MKWTILAAVLFIFASCKHAGEDLLTGADKALKEGNYAAALLNINQFFKQYPTSPDTGKAKAIQTEAGTAKRGIDVKQIGKDLDMRNANEAKKKSQSFRYEYTYLADNDRYFAQLDSMIRRVEFRTELLDIHRAMREAKMDSVMAALAELHTNFANDSLYYQDLSRLDSLIAAGMKDVPKIAKVPPVPVPPQGK